MMLRVYISLLVAPVLFLAGLAVADPTGAGLARRGDQEGHRVGVSRSGLEWDVRQAARAMDKRIMAWDRWDKSQRSLETTCISCHTSGPYLLARSELRGFAPSIGAGAAEENLLTDVVLRSKRWDDIEPWYQFNDEKKVQSLGTEAVWNALILSNRDAADPSGLLVAETLLALEIMWKYQRGDGSWEWLEFGIEPWESINARAYGAALAAIAVGFAPPHYRRDPDIQPRLERLKTYLQLEFRREDQFAHNKLFILWASDRLEGLLSASEQGAFVDRILSLQRDDGGWRSSDIGDWAVAKTDRSDAYATGLVSFVLQKFRPMASPSAIDGSLTWLAEHQGKSGAWSSESMNKTRDPDTMDGQFMSDAASAFAVLALTSARP